MGQVKKLGEQGSRGTQVQVMTKTAWVFPGQGSQSVGMGMDLLELSAAKDKFELAQEILGWSVPEI